ncbi:type II toxin-antitoxin system PemK/MazF family toxin [Rhodoflexus caldus]|uniref:type II toxin-antitoxin system PemK/MazF family toxin n=1 Tax=Rhodoflexus caldus TaxID=2891236 RepID=UPI00202A605D|nr:type II toxin-antitoxin system PemK/MazF family toxin [Rhodoflexus caldus]
MQSAFTKSDILLVNFGQPPTEIKGHEQGYERPCIVIKSLNHLQLAIVVPLTTKEPAYLGYSTVKIAKGTSVLHQDSYVLCHQIKTISFQRITKKLGSIERKTQLKIEAVLIDLLEL